MADDALLERIDAHLARQVTLHDIMHMDHAELRAWQREGLEGLREMTQWIRQMAEEFRNFRRESARESAERRREFEEHRRELVRGVPSPPRGALEDHRPPRRR